MARRKHSMAPKCSATACPAIMPSISSASLNAANAAAAAARLGRNSIDVQTTVNKLAEQGVRVHCLALGGVDLTSPAGKMTMGVIAAVAQFEKDLLIERTLAGQARAKAEGKKFGRPAVLTDEGRAKALQRLADGASISAVAREMKASRATIMRVRLAGGTLSA